MKQWNGEGLPPVGTVCQWLASGDHDWINVTVLGHDGEDTWLKPDDGTQSFIVSCAEDFRLLPTERDLAVQQMFYDLPENMRPCKDVREAIYDAGYRKVVAAPGFEWRLVCRCCGSKVESGQELYHGC